MSSLSRREFLAVGAAAGAGLVIGFYLPHGPSTPGNGSFSPNAFLKIAPDGKITAVVARSEMGQGVRTSLPMILAEELDADWKQITVEQAGTDTSVYGDELTGGSASVRVSWVPLRQAGAAAREMLITAAALQWGVPRSSCTSENSSVIHAASGRRVSYGNLVVKAATLPIPSNPPLKDAKDFKLVGKSTPRLDAVSKVDGSAVFGIDFRVPGMKYAVLARCPVIGGKVKNFDDHETRKLSGISCVCPVGDSAMAVVADSVWGAMEGRRVLNVNWDEGPNKDLNSAAVYDALRKGASGKAATLYSKGDVSKASGRRIHAEYQTPLMAHAPMEPDNCTAHFRGSSCELWAPTQWPPDARDAVAKALSLDPDQVTVHVTLIGGGFGRRLEHDYAVEAALVSKATNAPVKVIWTREDDMRNSTYRPASYHLLKAVLDGSGWPVAFSHRIVAPSINMQKGFPGPSPDVDGDLPDEASLIYSFPNAVVEYVMTSSPVPAAYMRSVYALETAFASESFIDELAAAAGKDPLEYRLHVLAKDEDIKFFDTTWRTERMRAALQLAAEKAGWGKPLPEGHYHGVACFGCFGTYMAEVVEISMENDQPRVHRVVGAIDCGQVVNPNILEQQIQGGVTFALTNALRAQITIDKGRVVQGNFDDYAPVRMSEAPVVEAYFVPSTEAPTGAGEPPVPPLAPALCNAIYAATKKRIRSLPILS
ncbi:MAG TPA: xanthine dehydrogenase family protein molybdopterin-binding subunit [Terriglobales bacterium]|nr:xanthine dehydrogenase family protein molybdopterin-binding subunit [Terriglobales bacterium]